MKYQMTTEETIAFLEGHEDPTFDLAKRLANAISYENGPELNALRMMSLLQPLMDDRTLLEWFCRRERQTLQDFDTGLWGIGQMEGNRNDQNFVHLVEEKYATAREAIAAARLAGKA